jgi:hypothetical protein
MGKRGTDENSRDNLIGTTAWLSQALGDYNYARDRESSKAMQHGEKNRE